MTKSENCIDKKTDESKLFLLICHVVDNLVTLPDKVFGRGNEKDFKLSGTNLHVV